MRDDSVASRQQSTAFARWLLARFRQQLGQQSIIDADSHHWEVYTQQEPKGSPQKVRRRLRPQRKNTLKILAQGRPAGRPFERKCQLGFLRLAAEECGHVEIVGGNFVVHALNVFAHLMNDIRQ